MKPMGINDHFLDQLTFLYGRKVAQVLPKLQTMLKSYGDRVSTETATPSFSQHNAVLIIYGHMVQAGEEAPLATLAGFLQQTVANGINTVHILPFYPYSSDDGFSVVAYTAVNPTLGTWANIHQLSQSFRLMFDAVVNHISANNFTLPAYGIAWLKPL
jgi:sucrose phosphorylase